MKTTSDKKYFTVSGGASGRSKLFLLTKSVDKKFKKEFPDFEIIDGGDRWELSLLWLEKNAKFVSLVECYCY